MTKQSDSGSSTATRLLEGPAQLSVDSALSLGLPTACVRPVLTISLRWLLRSVTGLLAYSSIPCEYLSEFTLFLSVFLISFQTLVFLFFSVFSLLAHSLILSLVALGHLPFNLTIAHSHTLPITSTCCYDEVKGTQDQDFACSFSDSLSACSLYRLSMQ